MVSISKKTASTITKIGLAILIVYTIGFAFYKVSSYYKTYFEKERLLQELQIKKNETNSLIRQIKINKGKIEKVKDSYIKKEELETKVKDIFERMSVFDYTLRYLDAKNMCVDRFVIIAQLTAQSEKGVQAGEGILSYIGEMKKSDKNESLYFVNYVATSKQTKLQAQTKEQEEKRNEQ